MASDETRAQRKEEAQREHDAKVKAKAEFRQDDTKPKRSTSSKAGS